ncbi:MAG: hypothetical protein LUQ18_10020 [Methylococcaceae bacterium]|nr:hypothetical protein [Methylococcaceae bacterium]
MNIEEYPTLDWLSFDDLIFSHLGFRFKSVDDLANKIEIYNGKIIWLPLKEWESLDDITIYNSLEELEKPTGEIFIISDISYIKKDGPFRLESVYIRKFIMQYVNTFNECLFDGDVLIFSVEHKLIWIFHHEGVYALGRLTQHDRMD